METKEITRAVDDRSPLLVGRTQDYLIDDQFWLKPKHTCARR